MTKRLNNDSDTTESPYLPFAAGEMDRSGLRLTRAEFARFMGVSKQAVGEWVTSGKIMLGADGRLDPRQAVSQLLRNSDPTRLRARVLAPLVRDVANLQKRIADLEIALASAKEDNQFNEAVADELAAQLSGLQRHLQEEYAELASLPGPAIVSAVIAWLDASDLGAADDLTILDCLPASDADLPKTSIPGGT